jgi:BirA family biotin operon repressor/biotin-[acetyl-CoA-carboxylase] ligase
MAFGFPHLHLATTTSTNAVAKRLAQQGAPEGMVVSADFQTAGRGRQGRSWWARPGEAVLASLLLRQVPPLVTLRAAVAIREALGKAVLIKWPNDLVLRRADGRWGKVCGILGEADPHGRFAVIGFGINVAGDPNAAPPALQDRFAALGLPPSQRQQLLAAAVASIEVWLGRPAEEVVAAFREADYLFGRQVAAQQSGRLLQGRAVGIDGEGALLLETAVEGLVALSGGEVHLLEG